MSGDHQQDHQGSDPLATIADDAHVSELGGPDADAAIAVLTEAFADYPVMQYILGERPRSGKRLEKLIGFIVASRLYRDDFILGVRDDDGRLAGVALASRPGERPVEPRLEVRRELLWAELGPRARQRYDAFGEACKTFLVDAPHHHLKMIGVLPACAGQGFARNLLTYLHGLVDADPASTGVTLTTESVRNVSLYRYFGYRSLGSVQVSPSLESWGFFRPAHAMS